MTPDAPSTAVARRTCGQQIQDILHAHTKTANRRTTATNVWADDGQLYK